MMARQWVSGQWLRISGSFALWSLEFWNYTFVKCRATSSEYIREVEKTMPCLNNNQWKKLVIKRLPNEVLISLFDSLSERGGEFFGSPAHK